MGNHKGAPNWTLRKEAEAPQALKQAIRIQPLPAMGPRVAKLVNFSELTFFFYKWELKYPSCKIILKIWSNKLIHDDMVNHLFIHQTLHVYYTLNSVLGNKRGFNH